MFWGGTSMKISIVWFQINDKRSFVCNCFSQASGFENSHFGHVLEQILPALKT